MNIPAQWPGDPGAGNARLTLSSSLLGRRHYCCQRLLPATSVFVQCKIKKKKKVGGWGRRQKGGGLGEEGRKEVVSLSGVELSGTSFSFLFFFFSIAWQDRGRETLF